MEENRMQSELSEKLLGDISKILNDLTRTIKIVSVYPDNNPLPAKLRESFIERFTDLIQSNNGLSFKISAKELIYQDKIVYRDRQPDDNLSAFFYDSGITQLTFSPAFDFEEGRQFFKVLKTYINREDGGEDLIALFWQAEINGFNYQTLEDFAMGEFDCEFVTRETSTNDDSAPKIIVGSDSDSSSIQYRQIFLDDDSDEDKPPDVSSAFAEVADPEATEPASPVKLAEKMMGMEPATKQAKVAMTDTTVILNDAYQMSRVETNRFQNVLAEDAEFDRSEKTIGLIRELLLLENEYSSFIETITIAERVQTEFIRQGKILCAGQILGTLKELYGMLSSDSARWKERIHEALVMAGGWENLSLVNTSLNHDPTIADEEIIGYLSNFDWEAISAITDMLGELDNKFHRLAVVKFLSETAGEHVDIIAKGISDRRWYVVRNTACILGGINNKKAISYLGRAITHEDSRVRLEVLRGLTQQEDITDVSLFLKLIWDEDALIKKEALAAVLKSTGTNRLKVIVNIINDDRFAKMEHSAQEKLVLIYSELAGEHSVKYLKSLISGLKTASSKFKDFYRKLAFKALRQNRSEAAEKALIELSRSWKKPLRAMAKEALDNRKSKTGKVNQ